MKNQMILDKIDEKANVETFIGTGNEIYCSRDNLYVTKENYNYVGGIFRNVLIEEEEKVETKIRKFAIYDGEIKYVAEGIAEIKGLSVEEVVNVTVQKALKV